MLFASAAWARTVTDVDLTARRHLERHARTLGAAAILLGIGTPTLLAAFSPTAAVLCAATLAATGGLAVLRTVLREPAGQLSAGGPIDAHLVTVSRRAGVDVPALVIADRAGFNSWVRLGPDGAEITVTADVVDADATHQLGVLAHEVAHVVNNDLLLLGVCETLAGAARNLAATTGRSRFGAIAVFAALGCAGGAGIVLAVLAAIAAALRRDRELLADLRAAEILGDSTPVIAALDQTHDVGGLFASHPSPARRRAALSPTAAY